MEFIYANMDTTRSDKVKDEGDNMNHWHQVDGVWLYGDKKLTATKAIHISCVECMGDNP